MAINIALAGNPNCGKTTMFNDLTGANQYVGNWPGVTVEKKEGRYRADKGGVVTDLPGDVPAEKVFGVPVDVQSVRVAVLEADVLEKRADNVSGLDREASGVSDCYVGHHDIFGVPEIEQSRNTVHTAFLVVLSGCAVAAAAGTGFLEFSAVY